MPQPNVLILRAPGTNCDIETAHAFTLAGGQCESLHVNRLLEEPTLIEKFQILCLPGGFSFGDDIAAGRILATTIQNGLGDVMRKFRDDGKLILGICNGFQVLIKSGLLLDEDEEGPLITLTWNNSGRFDDRWVRLGTTGSKCVFLRDIDEMYIPIAHAEGKFVAKSNEILDTLESQEQLALRYLPLDANAAVTNEILPPPANPNGSQRNIAGMCDATGRVFGLMPHPERHLDDTHHPRFTRGESGGRGNKLFENAINFFS